MSEEDWEDFWQTLDFIRLQLERPLSSSFKASFDKLLPFRERLALPGVADRLRILGGDATLDRFGSLDWKDRRFASEDATPYLAQLTAQLPNFDHGEIISIVELMAFVAFAGKEGPNWSGDLVLYVTDNDNVRSWLTKRRPRNHFARLMICLSSVWRWNTISRAIPSISARITMKWPIGSVVLPWTRWRRA